MERARFETDHPGGSCLEVHRHDRGYVALVLEGSYEELSADGRFACVAGTVVVHPAFHAHANRFDEDRTRVLNALLQPGDAPGRALAFRPPPGVFDSLLELVLRDALEGGRAALEEGCSRAAGGGLEPGWAANLLDDLHAPTTSGVAVAAARRGVSPEHAARHLKRWIGLSPREVRAEARLRRALERLRRGSGLLEAALEAGYCDQSHMCRDFRRLLGAAPGAVLARIRSVQEGNAGAP